MFSSSSNFDLAKSTATTDVMAIGFSQSKHTIKRGTTTLTSYLDANQNYIPTSHQVFHNV
jgi:hypothetical protein